MSKLKLYHIPICSVLALCSLGAQAVGVDMRYEECSKLTLIQPSKSLAMAQEWVKDQPDNLSAAHCEAMSYYALKQYAMAEAKLAALAARKKTVDPRASAQLSEQAAQAAAQAGDITHGITYATDGIALATQNNETKLVPDLLLQRGKLYLSAKKPFDALQDAEHGLSLAPKNKELSSLKKNALNQIEALVPAPKPAAKKKRKHK